MDTGTDRRLDLLLPFERTKHPTAAIYHQQSLVGAAGCHFEIIGQFLVHAHTRLFFDLVVLLNQRKEGTPEVEFLRTDEPNQLYHTIHHWLALVFQLGIRSIRQTGNHPKSPAGHLPISAAL